MMQESRIARMVAVAICLATSLQGAFAHTGLHDAIVLEGIAATQWVQTGNGVYTFESVPNWCQIPQGVEQLGNTHGNIVIDKQGLVYFNTDTERSIMVYAKDGSFLRSFGAKTKGIHDMVINTEDGTEYIYAAHLGGQQVVKYTLDGKRVWTIPLPKESGKYDQEKQRYRPTAVTVAPDGSVYVADGYGQNWIHQFGPDQEYVRSFGGRGKEPGKFITCHGLRVDTRTTPATLVVCDRENRRLQRFSLDGKFIEVLVTGLRRPCHVDFRGNLTVVAELQARVTILDKDFHPIAFLGDNPNKDQWAKNPVPPEQWKEGIFTAPHGVKFDHDGNLYVMDWNRSGRVSKLVWQR